jgi:hypothetical protein
MKTSIEYFKKLSAMLVLSAIVAIAFATYTRATTPGIINYQGRVLVTNAPFTGPGNFRFALVNNTGTTSFWSNDGTSAAGSQPTAAVPLTVTNGLYSVVLGDTTIAGMTLAIPSNAFSNTDVRLRVWFDDGTNGIKQLMPDQRVAAVGYALIAQTVDDLGITTAKLANNAVTSAKVSSFPKCSVTHSTNQAILDATNALLAFDTVRYDNDSIHNAGNTSRHTVNTAGVYLITYAYYVNCGGTGYLNGGIEINGVLAATDVRTAPAGLTAVVISTQVQLNAGDYIECRISNATGATCTVFSGSFTPLLQITRLP